MAENSVWEKIRRSGAWQVVVKVATVVTIVAAVAAFILTGPIAVILAVAATVAGVILAINDVMEWDAGLKSGWEAAFSVITTVIPGGLLLKAGKVTTASALRIGLKLAPKTTTALRTGVKAAATGLTKITRIETAATCGARSAESGAARFGVRGPESISEIEGALSKINPNYDPHDLASPWGTNCGMTTEQAWNLLAGRPYFPATTGTYNVWQMEQITGGAQIAMRPSGIASALQASRKGAHAIVGVEYEVGGGHWLNAFFDGENMWAIDAQINKIEL